MAKTVWEALGMGDNTVEHAQATPQHPPLDRTMSIARSWLEDFPENFRLYPLDGHPIPEPNEWSDFLRDNPQYATGKDRIFATALASNREVSESMDLPYQQLAGTIIRISFTDEQLMTMLQQ